MIISAKATMRPTTKKKCVFCLETLPVSKPRISMYIDDGGKASMVYSDIHCALDNGLHDLKLKKACIDYGYLVDLV